MAALTGRELGGVPSEEVPEGAAERDRFVRKGIPPAVYEACAAQARALRLRAMAAAFTSFAEIFSGRTWALRQERSV